MLVLKNSSLSFVRELVGAYFVLPFVAGEIRCFLKFWLEFRETHAKVELFYCQLSVLCHARLDNRKVAEHCTPTLKRKGKNTKTDNVFFLSAGYDPVAVLRWAIVRAFFRAFFAFIDAGKRHRKSAGKVQASSKYPLIETNVSVLSACSWSSGRLTSLL